MKRTKKILFFTLLGLSVLGIPFFAFGIINSMVSQKYETSGPTDCISGITGEDLCFTIQLFKGLIIACAGTILLLTFYRRSFIK